MEGIKEKLLLNGLHPHKAAGYLYTVQECKSFPPPDIYGKSNLIISH